MSTDRAPRTLATGVGFAEGPVITPAGVVFVTSIDQGRVYRITGDGAELLAETGGGANGAALAADGTLYIAQNGGRWARNGPRWPPTSVGGVQAISPDGKVSWVTQEPIAPNDICFGPDGLLYLSDPTRAPRVDDGRIWRVDPATGDTELLRSVGWFPNGIGFGADDRLYVASTSGRRIHRFPVESDRLGAEETVIQMQRRPDGFAFDADGRLLIGALPDEQTDGGEVQIWNSGGRQEGSISIEAGTHITNVALSPERRLVIAASDVGAVLGIDDWGTAGLPLHPFR